MFKHLFTTLLRSTAGRSLGAGLSFCLVLLALSSMRRPAENTAAAAGNRVAHERSERVVNQKKTIPAPRQHGHSERSLDRNVWLDRSQQLSL